MSALRSSEAMRRDGFLTMPFPAALSDKMIGHIGDYIGRVTGFSGGCHRDLAGLTQAVATLGDDDFVAHFAKPLRIFPDSIGRGIRDWVASLAKSLGGSRAGINYVSRSEAEANPLLTPTSLDVFWRCVRSDKPDVGRPHADFQFWEINRGTSLDPSSEFDYDERWKIWLPLMGCDETNSLEVIPGSHNEAIPFESVLTKYGTKPSISNGWLEANNGRLICPLSQFEHCCVLFHDKLVHRGPSNRTGKLRLSAEMTILLEL